MELTYVVLSILKFSKYAYIHVNVIHHHLQIFDENLRFCNLYGFVKNKMNVICQY